MFLFVDALAQQVNLDHYQPLTSDLKSYNVGEPIVVLVVETTSAEASAGTGTEKSTGILATANNTTKSVNAGLGIDANSDGSGKTSRKGSVTTQLSAKVVDVLSQDMVRIAGVQEIIINGEKQKITVTGSIRVKDISKNNTVFSYQISDAVIEIAGDGNLSKVQKQNIISRFLNWIGLL